MFPACSTNLRDSAPSNPRQARGGLRHLLRRVGLLVCILCPFTGIHAAEAPAHSPTDADLRDYEYWRTHHWAWRPLQKSPPRHIDADDWSRSAIDRFVLAHLTAENLSPSPQADRATLYRRLHFDLLGLPPAYEEVQAFVADRRADAYERVVDRLLASPAYGETWGRHWLDVARYADNGGFNSQTKELYTDFPYAYTYRDYVVRAFNEDLPYDRFIIEQIAADKLDLGEDNRALAALGFLTLGDKSFGVSSADRIDDCIDTVTRGLLGLTMSCARCHDHKYDPVPIEDYYSLFSVFQNSNIDVASRLHTLEKSEALPPLFESQEDRTAFEEECERATQALDSARQQFFAEALEHCRQRLADYLLAAARRASDDRSAGLSEEIVKRWRKFLKKDHPSAQSAFAVWRRFAALEKEFDPQAFQRTLDELLVAESAQQASPGNALILAELQTQPVQSIADVADAYGRVFGRMHDQFSGGREAESADEQALVDVLQAEESPLNLKRDDALKLAIHGGGEELKKLRERLHHAKFDHPRAVALADKGAIAQGHVYQRGNPRNRGEPVARQFLALLSPQREAFASGSGRLELAHAIVDPRNPLTARVMVNRVWHHHFGRGLVENNSDFGTRSDPPSHLGLLDHLASCLIEDGWSIKGLHRRILLSATYRQSSYDRQGTAEIDPDNRLLWRMNRRRLTFEGMRDSLLAASGGLDRAIGGRAVDAWDSSRRTLYGYVNRYRIAAGYMTFDFPSTNRTAPKRSQTMVPQQSLFLMNAPFVEEQARRLVSRREFTGALSDADRLQLVYRWTLSRDPQPAEREAALQFVGDSRDATGDADSAGAWHRLAHALFLSNEFMHVD